MEVTTVLLAFSAIVVCFWILNRKSKTCNLPGPYGLPIVGYMPFLAKKPYVKLQELAKRYGPIYRVKFGSVPVVVICDYNIMKKSFAEDALMGRPPDLANFRLSEINIKKHVFGGFPWKEQRRFALHMLRDLGFGRSIMETHIKEEIYELLERMESNKDSPILMSEFLRPSTSNNIASLLFGKRLKYNDPERIRLDELVNSVSSLIAFVSWQIFFPWLGKVITFLGFGNQAELNHVLEEVIQYIRKELIEHEKTLDPNNLRDFMDGYLLEIKKRSDDPHSTFHNDILVDLSRLFFGAGTETVQVTVNWVLLICAEFSVVQKKVQQEIDEVLGRDRFPTWSDRQNMPYTDAVISEVFRFVSIVPLNLMKYTLEDTEINGYFIPKGTRVLSILYAVDKNESLWGNDVHEFRPERFLSKDGKTVVKPEYFIPFSTGKRSCPGKSLADIEIFLYVLAILQRFTISLPDGKKADLEGVLGITNRPKDQKLLFTLRQ